MVFPMKISKELHIASRTPGWNAWPLERRGTTAKRLKVILMGRNEISKPEKMLG
jgi:hypothetical protein